MRIVFAGTPEFSVPCLQALIESDHDVIAVYTQPDRPAGRGRKLTPSAVKNTALEHDIAVYQPVSLKNYDSQQQLAQLKPDVMIVIAYGLILPQQVLDIPKYGCINVHASILPRWRGAAPIQRSIIAGDRVTGVTIMQMDKGLDTGPMLAVSECDILSDDTSQTLHDKLAQLGAAPLLSTLKAIENGSVTAQKQNDTQACYADKLSKEEAHIDWSASAQTIVRQVNGYNPWPVAYTMINQQRIKIYGVEFIAHDVRDVQCGTILVNDEKLVVACGDNAVSLTEIQLAGAKRLATAHVLNSKRSLFEQGTRFD